MLHFLHGFALIAVMILNCEAASAKDIYSGKYMVFGCRAWVTKPLTPGTTAVRAAFCAGDVMGLRYATGICVPEGVTVTVEQAIRVVVKYIDDRPERLNENFNTLALEALRAAWPCKK